jgi:hypothetical protein
MAQNFFIRKNSNLPLLKLKVINDGRREFRKIYDRLENAAITFSMMDLISKVYYYLLIKKFVKKMVNTILDINLMSRIPTCLVVTKPNSE